MRLNIPSKGDRGGKRKSKSAGDKTKTTPQARRKQARIDAVNEIYREVSSRSQNGGHTHGSARRYSISIERKILTR